jgi:PAS domain S-box-containing protein
MASWRILIVEDEAIVARNLASDLGKLAYTIVATASAGEQAIQLAGETGPDLVLMDIDLRGEMDGIEAAERIHARFDIPVVYLTAYADDRTLQRAKVTEPFGYIVKPFSLDEVHSSIQMALYKHEMETRLRASEERYRALFDQAFDAIVLENADRQILDANQAACELYGYARPELLATKTTDLEAPEAQIRPALPIFADLDSAPDKPIETVVQHRDSRPIPVELTITPLTASGEKLYLTIARNISERKQAEKERERIILELQDALAKVKTLSGLLPICASCKRIRDDAGYWTQVEVYIRDHADVEFSHGICPECFKKLYPDFQREDE